MPTYLTLLISLRRALSGFFQLTACKAYRFFGTLVALSTGVACLGAVNCNNNGGDTALVQAAINAGGTQTITGTCYLGSSAININNPVVVQGGANFVADASVQNYSFNVNVSNVAFNGMTFTAAGVHVNGSAVSKFSVSFTNNAFQNFTMDPGGMVAAIEVDPIWQNSTVTGNTFNNLWIGGFGSGCDSFGSPAYGSSGCTNEGKGLSGIWFYGGLDNTRIEYNTFNQISYDGVKGFNNGLSAPDLGYQASGASVSYNTFTYWHRMGIEIQNCSNPGNTCGGLNNVYLNPKFNGNFFYHPAYSIVDTFAISMPTVNTGGSISNNSMIDDTIGNATTPITHAGIAIEDPPGGFCCGLVQPGGMVHQGNVISGDSTPALNSGWSAIAVYVGFLSTAQYQNFIMCGPPSNQMMITGTNVVDQYNFRNSTCPGGSGTGLWASQASMTLDSSQSSGGTQTFQYSVVSNLSIRYVNWYVDGSTTPVATQEIQDVNSNFQNDTKWKYHVVITPSSYGGGSHTLVANATDASGAIAASNTTTFVNGSAPTTTTAAATATLSFGTVNTGSSSAPQSVNLTNTGAANLTISSISVTGAASGDFSQSTTTCTSTLAPNASCNIAVTFSPSAAGSRVATLTVNDNVAGGTQLVALSGTGVTPGGTPTSPIGLTPPVTSPASSLPAGMILWLAQDLGVVSDGTHVSTWQDQSGNGNDAVQGSAPNQPSLVASSGNSPALHFDGHQSSLSIPSLPAAGLTGMTVFAVSSNSYDESSAGFGLYSLLSWQETAPWGETYFGTYQSSSHFRFGTTQSGNENQVSLPFSGSTSAALSEWMHATDTDSIWINGQVVGSFQGKLSTLAGIGASVTIGQGLNNTYYPGDVSEIIIYNRSLSDSERQLVEQYLMAKYNLATL